MSAVPGRPGRGGASGLRDGGIGIRAEVGVEVGGRRSPEHRERYGERSWASLFWGTSLRGIEMVGHRWLVILLGRRGPSGVDWQSSWR